MMQHPQERPAQTGSKRRRQAKGGNNLVKIAVVMVAAMSSVEAWSNHQKTFRRQHQSPTSLPVPQPSLTSQQMLKNPGNPRVDRGENPSLQHPTATKGSRAGRRTTTKLSHSVLADCDTLPSFPTAHGLLSPETVMRLEELSRTRGHGSEALVSFLEQYRRKGPLSCLTYLSDPEVLPHLTSAMRDVTE